MIVMYIYITCILPYEYYIGIYINDCLNICIYSCLGGGWVVFF